MFVVHRWRNYFRGWPRPRPSLVWRVVIGAGFLTCYFPIMNRTYRSYNISHYWRLEAICSILTLNICFVCLCVCKCMSVRVCECEWMYVWVCVYVSVWVWVCECEWMCVCLWVCMWVYVCVYVCECVCMCECVCVCERVCVCVWQILRVTVNLPWGVSISGNTDMIYSITVMLLTGEEYICTRWAEKNWDRYFVGNFIYLMRSFSNNPCCLYI
jgi:hypothetical protein